MFWILVVWAFAQMACFKLKKTLLDIHTKGITPEITTLAHHTVTRHKQAHRVLAIGHAYSSCFAMLPHSFCLFCVSPCLSIWNHVQHWPCFPLKQCALQFHRHRERLPLSSKILLHLLFCLPHKPPGIQFDVDNHITMAKRGKKTDCRGNQNVRTALSDKSNHTDQGFGVWKRFCTTSSMHRGVHKQLWDLNIKTKAISQNQMLSSASPQCTQPSLKIEASLREEAASHMGPERTKGKEKRKDTLPAPIQDVVDDHHHFQQPGLKKVCRNKPSGWRSRKHRAWKDPWGCPLRRKWEQTPWCSSPERTLPSLCQDKHSAATAWQQNKIVKILGSCWWWES